MLKLFPAVRVAALLRHVNKHTPRTRHWGSKRLSEQEAAQQLQAEQRRQNRRRPRAASPAFGVVSPAPGAAASDSSTGHESGLRSKRSSNTIISEATTIEPDETDSRRVSDTSATSSVQRLRRSFLKAKEAGEPTLLNAETKRMMERDKQAALKESRRKAKEQASKVTSRVCVYVCVHP